MRRSVCALMMTLVLLSGCSRGEQGANCSAEELALNIRTEYLAMSACSASVDVTADYGQRVYEYSIDISWEKNGETRLVITAPEELAGVTARIREGKSYLEFDGVSLETGVLSGTGLSPVEAVPAILDSIASGYITACDFETSGEMQQLWFLCRDPGNAPGVGVEAAFWFYAENHTLMKAEILSDGYSVIRCVFREFTKE